MGALLSSPGAPGSERGGQDDVLEALQARLAYRFRDPGLLARALTHRSFGQHHNERLEFLGDAVLGLSVSTLLFERDGRSDEGDLSRLRAQLVRQDSLHGLAVALGLSEALRLGEGEWRSGGAHRPSILADALEAILGAVYVDGGFPAAHAIVSRWFMPVLQHEGAGLLAKDPKTELQEWLQGRKLPVPTYRIVATHGQAHRQRFDVSCEVAPLGELTTGTGASRRAAEQVAAKIMLARLRAGASDSSA